MLGSFRAGQHRRLWEALGRPDLAALSSVADQEEHREVFAAALREVMLTRTAAEWEEFLAGIHVPGARMRNVAEALELKQVAQRNLLHRFEKVPDVDRPLTVPVAGFRFADGWAPRGHAAPRPRRRHRRGAGRARAHPGGDCVPAPGPRRLIRGRRTPDGRIRVGSTPEGASDLAGTTLRPVRSWR